MMGKSYRERKAKKPWIAMLLLACLVVLPGLSLADSCIDNKTLNGTFYLDGWHTSLTVCENGCDYVTASCSPPKLYSDLLSVAAIIIIIAIIIMVARWLGV